MKLDPKAKEALVSKLEADFKGEMSRGEVTTYVDAATAVFTNMLDSMLLGLKAQTTGLSLDGAVVAALVLKIMEAYTIDAQEQLLTDLSSCNCIKCQYKAIVERDLTPAESGKFDIARTLTETGKLDAATEMLYPMFKSALEKRHG